MRTRRQPWQRSTRSWQAAYNLACAYAAIAHKRQHKSEAAPNAANADVKRDLETLVRHVVTCLEFALCNPDRELERPSEWIAVDPDFDCSRSMRPPGLSWTSSPPRSSAIIPPVARTRPFRTATNCTR